MRVHVVCGLFVLGLLLSPCLMAQDTGWAVVAKAGTVGFGADVHRSLVPKVLNLRVGASFFRHSLDISDNDIDYSGRLKLGAVPIMADVYPFKNWFRLGGGVFINLNEVDGTAKPSQGLITINGHTYSTDEVGQLEASVKFNRASPYFGIGFSNPIKRSRHWGVTFDLGVMYHGQPDATLAASGVPSAQLAIDITQQVQRFENDAQKYTIFPILQFGVSYHFTHGR